MRTTESNVQYLCKVDAVGPSDGSRTPAMADKLHCVVMIDHFGVGDIFILQSTQRGWRSDQVPEYDSMEV